MERDDLVRKLITDEFILITLNGKQPVERGWQERITSVQACEFGPNDNVGVVLGGISGIVDIDIDSHRALEIADVFLPPTDCRFGRATKPNSHWLYRVANAGKTRQFQHPSEGMIVELRGNGGQTMIPPSVHPEGEEVIFSSDGSPTVAEWDALQASVVELAVATVVQPYWKSGNRHDCCLALAGVLHGSGWSQERAGSFVERLAKAFGDEEQGDRLACVESTYQSAQQVSGTAKLGDIIGEEDSKLICKWAGWKHAMVPGVDMSGSHFKTDADCAEQFSKHYKDKLLYSLAEGQWHQRRNGVYVPISEVEVQSAVLAYGEELKGSVDHRDMNKFLSATGVRGIIALARSNLGVKDQEFDSDHDLIGCQNGVLNLRTGELSQQPGSIVTRRIAAVYDPNAKCPQFLKFLNEIFKGDQEVISYLRRCMGYTLQGGVQEQCLFVCIGSGRNGKSTFLNILGKLMGDYSGSLPMASLMDKKFGSDQTNDLATLRGKRFIACQEGEASSKLAEAKVKLLTGGDKISARLLYQNFKDFWPTHKLWLATNELPRIDGNDEGIWRRMQDIIRFPVTIPQEEVDLELGNKLSKEFAGTLNFAIEGYQDWKETRLKRPSIVVMEYRDYRSSSDTVGSFIEACCIVDRSAKSSTADLYNSYSTWCDHSGLVVVSKSMFGKNLGQRGYDKYKGNKGNGWLGIMLTEDYANSNIPERFAA